MAKLSGNAGQELIRLASGTALVVLGLFCAWQAWLIVEKGGSDAQLQSAQTEAVRSIGSELAHERQAAVKALNGIDPVSALADPATARATVQSRLPQLTNVEFYSGGLDEVLHANYRSFGYAKASQLLAAAGNGEAPPIQAALHGANEHRLSLVLPLGSATPPLAWAWLELPFAPVEQRLIAVSPGKGRIDLRMGHGQDGLRLLSNGSATAESQMPSVPVPGANLSVGMTLSAPFIVLPFSPLLAGLLALVGIGGGAYLLWSRVPLSLRHRSLPAEETFAIMISSSPTPELSPAPTKAIAHETPSPATPAAAPAPAATVDASMFRAYDVRGVVGRSLTPAVARLLGQAVGSVMQAQGLREIVVGRDGRISGPELTAALSDGLREAGVDVIDVGAVPTPVVYYAAYRYNTGSGIAVTGSHNPPDYNGFKIVLGGQTLAESAIQELYQRIVEGRLESGGSGRSRSVDVVPDYLERISGDVLTGRAMKVVVDCGNGIPGALAPELLERLGCEVVPLYCDVDGTFPNHHPDPSDPHNLEDLILTVKETKADIGLAFDGDGDRLGVVTRQGEIIYPDRTLMLFARDVLSRHPGATIIYDVKCTGHLKSEILNAGGSPLMWRTGHSLIKSKMRETGAELAGEMSGHFFFQERWYGFDDGLYAAARLLEILSNDPAERTPEAIFATCPKGVSTPELKIELAEGEHYRFMDKFVARAQFEGATLITIDGVRADWSDGWGLVRPSNTTPVLVLRFDADNAPALARIKQVFREQLLAVDPDLKLPF